MPYKLISIIKKAVAANLLFVIFIVIISTILIIGALPENHMDMTSAQTVLAARWWARDAFFNNYFLQLPSGYGKLVRYFDEPQLQQHAKGDIHGSLTGSKIYYTRYPSLYILPIALTIKLGIDKLFLLRLVSIIASILGLVFLYLFIKLLSNQYIALAATVYFGISPIFIKWADSLEYIAQEDMWRFLILFISLLVFLKLKENPQHQIKRPLMSIWITYLFLSLTSFNSTFFIFAWLIGLSAIYLCNSQISYKVRTFLFLAGFWALAPILGFTLQLIQNAAYLGWHNTLLDIYGAINAAGNRTNLDFATRFDGMLKPFLSALGFYGFYSSIIPLGIAKFKQIFISSSIPLTYVLTILTTAAVAIILKLKKTTGYRIPSLNILALLALAPIVQTFALPLTGYRDSMGRLAAPFIGIIIGIILWMLYLALIKRFSLSVIHKITFSFIFLSILSLFAIQIISNNAPRFWPAYSPLSDNEFVFSQKMKNIATGEKAIFMINKIDAQISEEEYNKRDVGPFFDFYRIWEYYFDSPLLNFRKTDDLIKDLLFLRKRAEFPFTAIVTSDDKKLINELHKNLADKNLPLSAVKNLENRYFFTVVPML